MLLIDCINLDFLTYFYCSHIGYDFFLKFRFLLTVLQKRFSQIVQSPCHHQTPQILLSLLPLSSPQRGPQQWRGQGLLLVPHWLLGQVHQPLHCRQAPNVDMLVRAFANKPSQKGSTFTPAALMRASILSSITVTSSSCRIRAE